MPFNKISSLFVFTEWWKIGDAYLASALGALMLTGIAVCFLKPRQLLCLVAFVSAAVGASARYGRDSEGVLDVRPVIKFVTVVPVGFGSLALFSSLPSQVRMQWRGVFSAYVSAAVVGNIVMMLMCPSGDTLRGHTSRVVCVVLSLWLLGEIHRRQWKPCVVQTTSSNERCCILRFSASPMSWVFAHSLYRMILVTLPAFDTGRYLCMEAASLAFTWLFFMRFRLRGSSGGKGGGVVRDDVSWYFGVADTAVVGALTTVSTIADTLFGMSDVRVTSPMMEQLLRDVTFDRCCVVVHGLIVIWSVAHVVRRKK